jgi:hypothetical protein
MIDIYAHCSLYGEEFSPTLAERESGVRFERKNEPGELGTIGRYRGKP